MHKYLLLISDFSLLLLLVLLLPKHVEAFNNETVIYEGEKYIQKEHIFIPWGEAESLVGYIPGGTTNEGTPEEMVWPGFGPKSWDVDIDENIYIVDYVKSRIIVYDRKGEYCGDVGRWNNEENVLTVKTSSGRTIVLSGKLPFGDREHLPQDYGHVYLKEIGDVAVDGYGYIYAIPYPSGTQLFKFSSNGRLVEIIDQFEEYGQEDIKKIGFDILSNSFGHIFVGMITKSKERIFVEFGAKGDYVAIMKDKIYPQDANGNIFDLLPDGKDPCDPDSDVSFWISDPKKTEVDTLTIYFEQLTSKGVCFKSVDGLGNIYINVDRTLLKYDQQGNLLAIIQQEPDTIRTFKNPMPGMAAVSKIMANGDIYDAYISDQGFVVLKYELQQETKGQMLKPAYIPEDMKK